MVGMQWFNQSYISDYIHKVGFQQSTDMVVGRAHDENAQTTIVESVCTAIKNRCLATYKEKL